MAFDHRNLRVFVSSKMRELAEERKVIKEALKESLIQTFVYEKDAGAREATIEQTFVEELQEADLYIGLFWQGYGEYTIKEYHLAGEHHLDRLIFEKHVEVEKRDPQLQKFLEKIGKVEEGVTIRWFSSIDELRSVVKEDVMTWLAATVRKARRREIPSLALVPEKLPCLCDRDPQEQTLQVAVLDSLREKQRRPLVLVVPGQVQEEHRFYIDRIELQSLLDLLTMANVRGQRKLLRVNEAIDARQPQRHFSNALRMTLAKKLQIAYQEDDQFLLEYARRQQIKALVLVLFVLSSELTQTGGTLLEKLCEYVATFPDLPEGLLLSVIVCCQYTEELQSQATGFWRRLLRLLRLGTHIPTTDGKRVLHEELQRCGEKYGSDPRLRFVELPALASPTLEQVFRWLELEQVKQHVRFVLRKDVTGLFAGRESLPMEDLYEKLLSLLPSGSST